MPTEKFSPQESLQLIQSMIDKTKMQLSNNSRYFLIWGWLTFIACTGQFILKHLVHYEKHYQAWLVIVIGMVTSIYFSIRDGKKRKVKTYVGESMNNLWMGMGISFFVMSFIMSRSGWEDNVFPFFIMMYGLGTFVSGRFLQFKPLVAGGIAAWILAIVASFLSYDYQILMGALAILVSYIIPGHLLQSIKKKETYASIG
jgi:hypothetical protein